MTRTATAFFIIMWAASAIAGSGVITEAEVKACVDLSIRVDLRKDEIYQKKRAFDQEADRINSKETGLTWLEMSMKSAKSTYHQCNPRFSNCASVMERANQLVREYNNQLTRHNKAIAEHQNWSKRLSREIDILNADNRRYNDSCGGKSMYETHFNKYCQGSSQFTSFCQR